MDENFEAIYDNKFKNIEKQGDLLYLAKLGPGYYSFTYHQLPTSKNIKVRVHEGKRWHISSNLLIKENEMIRLLNEYNYLTYCNLQVTEKEINLKVLSNEIDSVKIHLLAFNYYPNFIENVNRELKGICTSEKLEVFKFAQTYHEYYLMNKISDEIKYSIERKKRPTFMGNTLEKPSGLLKRQFKRNTQADPENLQGEAGPNSHNARTIASRNKNSNRSLTQTVYEKSGTAQSFNLVLMNSFLKDRGHIIANSTADADGNVSIDISKLNKYSTLVMIIEDKLN